VDLSDPILAALIQGAFTFLAGLSALGGGYLAYRAAMADVALKQREAKRRERAYRKRLHFIAQQLRDELSPLINVLVHFDQGNDDAPFTFPIRIPDEFQSANWEKHSLLSGSAESLICILTEQLKGLQVLFDYIHKSCLSPSDAPHHPKVKNFEEKEEHYEVTFYNVAEHYQTAVDDIFNTLKELIKLVSHNSPPILYQV